MLNMLKKERMKFRKESMKNKTDEKALICKNLLIVLCGEIETINKTTQKEMSDAAVIKKIKSYISTAQGNLGMGMNQFVCETEIALLSDYLPKQLSNDELTSAIQEAIDSIGATTMKDMGKVMARINQLHGGLFDGSQASSTVKSMLN